ncbi:MAG: polyprenol monophosphomannose synthase [Patescibacteria group bacterium]
MHVSLVVPTLNERGSIIPLFQGLSDVAQAIRPRHDLDVIVVDDGSSDGTVEQVRRMSVPFPVHVIVRSERGLSTAVLEGFRQATGEVLGVMDADLSHPPAHLADLLVALETVDVAIGSRSVPGGAVEEWPWYRKVASWCATLFVRPLGVRVRDPMSGFFVLRREVMNGAPLSPIGYKILLEILVKGRIDSVREVPYVFRNREVGKSKMGTREGLNYLRHLARLYRWKYLGAS